MLHPTRHALILALLSCLMAFSVTASSQEKVAVNRAVVTGTVTIKGKPAADIVVALSLSEPAVHSSFRARTDKEGNYRITGVPSGTYYITPIAPAFVYSNKVNPSRGESLVIIGAETIEGIDFDLLRGGAVSGRVTDADERPVIEQSVYLMNADLGMNQRGQVYPMKEVQTDDRGVYRIFGIQPGRYKVAAGQGEDGFYSGPDRSNYKQAFYADASDASTPAVIEITEGSDVSNINITLRAVQTYSVSGRVVGGESAKPLAGIRFGLQLISDGGQRNSFSTFAASSNSQGDFKLENLRPGKYGIFIAPQPLSNLRSDPVPFEIVDQDVSGIVVKSSTGGASVSGVIVIENNDDKAVWAQIQQFRVFAHSESRIASGFMRDFSPVGPDGSFTFNGLDAGSWNLSLWGPDRAVLKRFNIVRIERNGIGNSRSIEVKKGEQITDVRVIVVYGSATVHGVVKVDNGPLPAGARVFMRIQKEAANPLPTQVDGRGNFIIDGIPPGLYEFEVNLQLPNGKARPPLKQQVNVMEGTVTNVVINFESPTPGPTVP